MVTTNSVRLMYLTLSSNQQPRREVKRQAKRDAVGQRLTSDAAAIFHISFIVLIENNVANCHVGTIEHIDTIKKKARIFSLLIDKLVPFVYINIFPFSDKHFISIF